MLVFNSVRIASSLPIFAIRTTILNLHELRSQLSQTQYTLVIALVMAVMVYIGFQLAQVNRDYLQQQLHMEQTTTQNLAEENQRLVTQKNELNVQLEISQLANEALDARIREGLQRERTLNEQVTFYQKVIAPELSEEGFSIDGVQVAATASENYYSLSMVLLQQTRIKDTISGNLNIRIIGSREGKPASIPLTELLPDSDEQSLRYSFKYFQTLSVDFRKPDNFVPERIDINTTIYQYRKRRGDYSHSVEWSQINDLESPQESE